MKSDGLIEELSQKLEPVEVLPSPMKRAALWFLISIVFVSALFGFNGLRPDFAQVSGSTVFWFETMSAVALLVIASVSAFQLAVPGAHSRWLKWFVVIPALIWAIQLFTRFFIFTPEHLNPVFGFEGLACVSQLVLSTLLPGYLLLRMFKKSAPPYLGLIGGLGLLAAGSLGAVGLQFSCYMNEVSHIAVWHVAPLAGFIIIGVLLGRRVLRW